MVKIDEDDYTLKDISVDKNIKIKSIYGDLKGTRINIF